MAQARIQIFWEGIQGKLQGGGSYYVNLENLNFPERGGGGESATLHHACSY